MASQPMPVARVRASEAAILFIAGGPKMLANVRDTDLRGAKPSEFGLALRRLASEVHGCGGAIGAVGHGVHGLPTETELPGAERRFVGRLDSEVERVAIECCHASGHNATDSQHPHES
jgi:hypothetical protein